MAELAGRVDPLEFDLLERFAGGVREHGFAKGDDTLLDARNGALEQHEVVLDLAVFDEAAHAEDVLVLTDNVGGNGGEVRTYGVICLAEASNSVVAFFSSLPLPTR
jgi:hypothetical protein